MATFVTLVKFTEKGIKDIKDTCKRAADFKLSAKKMGVEIKEIYWCPGVYDGLMIFDAPSVEAASALTLDLAARGNVQTQTTRAFTASEMEKILKMTGQA